MRRGLAARVREPEKLDKWLGGYGKVENINNSPVVGKAYYGIFLGEKYV